ncbi:MAG: transposase [Candidatus Endonucleobacter sp. (ex Gigantidas childressi)]|nr:transposase [Candidatus Endonucleobacter sp. (ex Gigantidas childressi)]
MKAGSDGKRKSTYGYKAHINVDEDGFIKSTDYTAGNVHDSNCFTELLGGDESGLMRIMLTAASRMTSGWLSGPLITE